MTDPLSTRIAACPLDDKVQEAWLNEELLKEFAWRQLPTNEWLTPEGQLVNGASIPNLLASADAGHEAVTAAKWLGTVGIGLGGYQACGLWNGIHGFDCKETQGEAPTPARAIAIALAKTTEVE